eukprot:tig00020685_g12968.t1
MLAAALGLSVKHNARPVTRPGEGSLWIEDRGISVPPSAVVVGPRVGIDYAGPDKHLPYRFIVPDSAWAPLLGGAPAAAPWDRRAEAARRKGGGGGGGGHGGWGRGRGGSTSSKQSQAAAEVAKGDAGCRNTVYNGRAQTGAEHFGRLAGAGARAFRVEFVDEGPGRVRRTLECYGALARGELSAADLWRELKLLSQLGVTRGSME